MSLPPLQSPAPELNRKTPSVTPPEPAKNQPERDFKGSMASASEQRDTERSEPTAGKSKDAGVEDKETNVAASDAEGGNDLPTEGDEAEATVITSAESVEAETNTIVLKLGSEALDPAKSDEAVLLAASFVVESLPKAMSDTKTDVKLSSNLPGNPASVMARLQALVGQGGGMLQQPTRQVTDGITLEQMDTTMLKELGKAVGQQSGAGDTADVLTAQSNSVEAKTAAAAATRTEMVIPNRVGSNDWGEAMAGRITLMVNQKISAARIHINPPELGPIEVRVNINHDQASVQFTSQSAQVRDALEQSIPRLRDMLETAGFSLADSGVNDQSPGQGESNGRGGGGDSNLAAEDESLIQAQRRETIGLVDDYV